MNEAEFTHNAVFNSHNSHIWSDENPHARQEIRFQRRFSINMWVGIIIVGPYVLPNGLNAAQYPEFLNKVQEEQLDVWILDS